MRADTAPPTHQTFSPEQIAERYCVSPATVRHWLASGTLRGINVSRSAGSKKPRWRVTSQAIAEFEAARGTTPTATAPRKARRPKSAGIVEFYK